MEHNSPFENFEMQFTNEAKDYLASAGKWATFLSIVGFISLAFMLLGALAMFAMGSAMQQGMASTGNPMSGFMSGAVLGSVYLILAIVCFFPTMYLFKFGSKAKQAINNASTPELTECIGNLKSFFKFVGIFTIVTIVFYIIFFFALIAIGVGAASAM